MTGQPMEYRDGDVVCEGYLAVPEGQGPFPAALVVHQWAGLGTQEQEVADRLAGLGYVGFAIDVFGKGVRGDPAGDNSALLQPWFGDRAALLQRLMAAIRTAQGHAAIDSGRIAAMGYCFGGLCVLDIARSGTADVKGVVSLHGVFAPPNIGAQGKIAAKILVCHGYADPMADPQAMLALADELTAADANWQIHAYGQTGHAFTRKSADNPAGGMAYNADADRRSWQASLDFLTEMFG